MFIVGLCGGSGAGKTMVSQMIQQYSFPVFDCDDVYHQLIATSTPLSKELIKQFGTSIQTTDGGIDTSILREIVFRDNQLLDDLNSISHRYVNLEFSAWLKKHQKYKLVFLEAPLLFESQMDLFCDEIIGIIADKDIRIKRIMERDKLTKEQAESRINHQVQDDFLTQHCTYIIQNNGVINDLEIELKSVITIIKEHVK